MDDVLMEELLHESEGTTVDFKLAQYPFAGAPDDKTSELLKDILAFCNAWRRTDAYILIGVRAVVGGRHEPVGTEDHFDDAHLQQFINGKTNRKVDLDYKVYLFEGRKIGVIRIAKQPRPIYTTRDFGKVQKGMVYYRLGSSTALASPEEVARMGAHDASERAGIPSLDIELGDPETRKGFGNTVSLQSVVYAQHDPSNLPDAGESSGIGAILSSYRVNRDYWRELADYVVQSSLLTAVGFVLRNKGSVLAQNVRMEFSVDTKTGIVLSADPPDRPRYETDIPFLSAIRPSWQKESTTIQRHGSQQTVIVTFGSVQPKATCWSAEPLYVGSRTGQPVTTAAVVYADNLPDPVRFDITFTFNVTSRPAITMEDLRASDAFLDDSDN